MKPTATERSPLPRSPVLDWSSFSGKPRSAGVSSIDDLRHSVTTTSGRAAIYHALLQLRLPPGSLVLAPSYHCPTMIAPAILAGLEVGYFAIRADGLPHLNSVDAATAGRAKAMIVSHYFGLARSLAEVRQWCDEHRIALIEDCAHCYFGDAGERPVGTWGDFSTASLSKFFPVPEGGVLASAGQALTPLPLSAPGLKAQLKGCVDVLEIAVRHGRLAGVNRLLASVFRLKNTLGKHKATGGGKETSALVRMMQSCDMERISQAPLWATLALKATLPRGPIIARRRQNFAIYARHFAQVRGARALLPPPDADAVPYVFPLWVEEPDRIYHALRAQEFPVFRWDNLWPGTPRLGDDVGPEWSHHVLQLLCHQNLDDSDVTNTALATLSLLANPQA
ncbi:MAG: L-glutamine:2-deoxy-scyllo-inosose aminotransferase [Candidatus Accumulibacter regalis]|jgi:perosamine synthetase|uniref:L-glutamine:2-deoxy-scyllo-inosose aminotransferase n=1 Tax=Accumulibacter regalis TaxID=522306 RepID=A0A011QG74_ACCRE|nr:MULTISPECIES: DegT/DnrJ/EryC1/StrS family aminotransferase [unclassified Candidatus Accumulibacter]EXI88040.1 MAG: L-glutamine:2-deoxy-scyllo-inosose aminotransferase [Candidatus Accumulibacter regalis]MQM34842.1 DegT/DnrJ/EryC1/StrS aminotransferase family protein [Candidatus Accumulibacter phosphatis]MBL8366697.1 DegT/DnrJ/EryC1/StrS aminotransferase family protein [Accumulibacter sp.]MBN8513025.1 DegT/DnrJ/EryC1/StrS aminotransferase family protein [Accumulibacter sp.]MBO3700930.1 DegT/D